MISPWLIQTFLRSLPYAKRQPQTPRMGEDLKVTCSNVCQSLFAIKAEGFQSAISEHLDDLGVFLTFFFEGEFSLFVVILVLASTAILTTLYYKCVSEPSKQLEERAIVG